MDEVGGPRSGGTVARSSGVKAIHSRICFSTRASGPPASPARLKPSYVTLVGTPTQVTPGGSGIGSCRVGLRVNRRMNEINPMVSAPAQHHQSISRRGRVLKLDLVWRPLKPER